MCELGWKSLGVLELTALPSIDEEQWVPWVKETDALLVGRRRRPVSAPTGCGNPDWPTSCRRCATVWVGVSGGSMVMTPNVGEEPIIWKPPGGGDSSAGTWWISRSFRTSITKTCRTTPWPTQKNGPPSCRCQGYAIDDQTAIKVTDGTVEVVSEGHWKLFSP